MDVPTHAYDQAAQDHGLICAFRLRADGAARRVSVAAAEEEGRTGQWWFHFNLADVRASSWVRTSPWIPAAARDLLLSNDRQLRFERLGDGLFVVLGDLHHELGATSAALDIVRIYVDSRVLISVRQHPLKSVDRLRRDLEEGSRGSHRAFCGNTARPGTASATSIRRRGGGQIRFLRN